MKKVAFTLGLAFFAIGLFAQNAPATGSNNAKATSAPVTTVKKEAMKPAQTSPAKPAAQGATAKTASSAPSAKPAQTAPAAKPAATSTAKAKPATTSASTKPVAKKHRRHKAKTTAPAGAAAPKTTAPKTSKQ